MDEKKVLADLELPEEKEFPIDCYANRELSWLRFNERVLEEAADPANPLCEQLNFLSIFQSNLDEFFMVRVGTLYDERKSKIRDNKSRMTSREQLNAVLDQVRRMLKTKDKRYRALVRELKLNHMELLHYEELSGKERHAMERYFLLKVLPLLSPQVITPKQPFPFLNNKEIYTVLLLEDRARPAKGKAKMKNRLLGIIPCSGSSLKRLVPVSADTGRYILLEELICQFAPAVFEQYRVVGSSTIRLVRNADISIDDDQQDDLDLKSKDYRKAMERMIATRKRMGAIKLEYSGKIDADLVQMICAYLHLPRKHAFYSAAPLDLSFLYQVSDLLAGNRSLFYEKRMPQQSARVSESESMVSQIRRKDILLAYPYESMRPFLRLLNEAAQDPEVVSIRITLYRVAKNSQVVASLIQAAENGKDVLALVELRARFDEENNVEHSRELENAGVRIIYGLDNIKVHSKLCLITRRSGDGIEYITQIGTGNYNEKTARLYTDYSLMTADPAIGEEAAGVFTALALGKTVEHTDTLFVAPNCLQPKIAERLDRQIALAKAGKPAYAGFKLNSLTDKVLIDKLIEASAAGVKIQMLIRGISCLVTGVPGYTDNIEIYSIVGRYLEHGRIYVFGCGGEEEVYISSADLMTRNTTRRVEVAVPIKDADVRTGLLKHFRTMLQDTAKLRVQQDDGSYVHVSGENGCFNVQEYFAAQSYRDIGLRLPEEPDGSESAPVEAPAAEPEAAVTEAPEALPADDLLWGSPARAWEQEEAEAAAAEKENNPEEDAAAEETAAEAPAAQLTALPESLADACVIELPTESEPETPAAAAPEAETAEEKKPAPRADAGTLLKRVGKGIARRLLGLTKRKS